VNNYGWAVGQCSSGTDSMAGREKESKANLLGMPRHSLGTVQMHGESKDGWGGIPNSCVSHRNSADIQQLVSSLVKYVQPQPLLRDF